MPLSDLWLVIQWWGTLFLVGAAAWPLTRLLFEQRNKGKKADEERAWYDGGYLFSKAVGMAVVAWLVYTAGTVHLLPFGWETVALALLLLFVTGFYKSYKNYNSYNRYKFYILFEEIFFFLALFFWSWIKAHEPSIRGLEKFMDYGFARSILNSTWFPPADMWYAGNSINYYYFGHIVMAVLTKLSGLDLGVTFNLMLSTLFALTLTMSFSIGFQLSHMSQMRQMGRIWKIAAGILTAFLVTLAGNLQTIYAFTRGYTGEQVVPFWQILWSLKELWQKLPEGFNTYWYANATRFIPFTIHEFPSYSFVVSDVHGHVLSLPFALLAIALLIVIYSQIVYGECQIWPRLGFYSFLMGVLLMTNATDGLVYGGLLVIILVMIHGLNLSNWINWKRLGIKLGTAGVVAFAGGLPFISHFKSFVSGLAINCPPAILAGKQIGPLIFEGVEKCQKSPPWMMWLLWGFFVYCGIFLIYSFYKNYKHHKNYNKNHLLLIIFFFFSLGLIIFPEFFYFKDIYPAHFRSNTMFKLGYQAFILFSVVSAYSIIKLLTDGNYHKFLNSKVIFISLLIPQLFLVSIYPLFSVRSYFNSLKNYEGIDGLGWLRREYPDDWAGIEWLNQNVKCQMSNVKCEELIIIEADGDSYTDYNRVSAFTGLPTVVGWAVHEWLWRKTYDVVAPRREEIRQIYEAPEVNLTHRILNKYRVKYIFVGSLERQKFQALNERKIMRLAKLVFSQGQTRIYEIF